MWDLLTTKETNTEHMQMSIESIGNTEKTKPKQNIHVTDVAKAMVIINLQVFFMYIFLSDHKV